MDYKWSITDFCMSEVNDEKLLSFTLNYWKTNRITRHDHLKASSCAYAGFGDCIIYLTAQVEEKFTGRIDMKAFKLELTGLFADNMRKHYLSEYEPYLKER